MSDVTKELDASRELEATEESDASWTGPDAPWDSPAAAESPDDYLERLLRSLDDRRSEPSQCDGFALCGDWPW